MTRETLMNGTVTKTSEDFVTSVVVSYTTSFGGRLGSLKRAAQVNGFRVIGKVYKMGRDNTRIDVRCTGECDIEAKINEFWASYWEDVNSITDKGKNK